MNPISQLDTKTRRALIVALGIACALLAGGGIALAHRWEVRRIQEALAANEWASRLTREFDEHPRVETRLRALRLTKPLNDSSVFTISNAGILGAAVIGVLRDIAGQNGVYLHSAQPRVDTAFSRRALVATTRANFTTDVQGLAGLIRDIESAKPLFRISEITVSQAEPFASDERPDVLKVELTVQAVAVLAGKGRNGIQN